jgi:hypothetical protein
MVAIFFPYESAYPVFDIGQKKPNSFSSFRKGVAARPQFKRYSTYRTTNCRPQCQGKKKASDHSLAF